MLYLVITFFASFLINIFVIRHFRWRALCDTCEGVQKFHHGMVPRVGGCSIYIAGIVAGVSFALAGKPFAKEFFWVFVCAFPLFLSGLLEDITKRVAPKWRLSAAFLSASLAFFLLSVRVSSVDVPLVDSLLRYSLLSFLFTAFAIAGVSHSFNIIDGLNGLASGASMLVFGAYAYVGFLLQDYFLLYLSLVSLFAVLGFFIWNYPYGFIFLGDCGAYLLGYLSATIGVLLVTRHPEVSPWFPLLLVIYPVWETLFSIYRRRFLKKLSPGLPDAIHLHSLVYKRLIRFLFRREINSLNLNSFASPYLWMMQVICIVPAVLFWNNTYFLVFFAFCFIIFYSWLYFRIIKFKTPVLIKKQTKIVKYTIKASEKVQKVLKNLNPLARS